MTAKQRLSAAFSLAELLIVLLVLGIILYFAFPNIVQVKSDSERELAKARAEALNMAAAAYVQANGTNVLTVAPAWADLTEEDRYQRINEYIAFPATSLSNFLPSADYSVTFDSSAPHKVKAVLKGPDGTSISY